MPARSPRRAAPRVFISYSHDSEAHRAAVLDLAQQLRGTGLDAQLDRYVASPPEGWPRWMLAQIERADFVVVVCTPTYRRRFEGKERSGEGHGATFEGLLALQLVSEGGVKSQKFVPVLLPRTVADRAIPLPLRPFTRFRWPAQMDELVALLFGRLAVEPTPLGAANRTPVRSDGACDVPVHREELLERLLLSLFDDGEFRRWIARDPACAPIADKLPGAAASREDVFHAAIKAMVRLGVVDRDLFERLLRKFPRRDADIRRTAGVWDIEPGATPRERPARSTRKTAARKKTPRRKARVGDSRVILTGGAKNYGNISGHDMHIHQEIAQTGGRKRRQ